MLWCFIKNLEIQASLSDLDTLGERKPPWL